MKTKRDEVKKKRFLVRFEIGCCQSALQSVKKSKLESAGKSGRSLPSVSQSRLAVMARRGVTLPDSGDSVELQH